MDKLKPHEKQLVGQWSRVNGKVVADDVSHRIEELISSYLTKLGASEDGWSVLYIDEEDRRKWELTYPHSDWHGGGPPTLTCVPDDYVRLRYKI